MEGTLCFEAPTPCTLRGRSRSLGPTWLLPTWRIPEMRSSQEMSLAECLVQPSLVLPPFPGHNYCAVNNGGCTHLCLATPGGRTCRCPDNTLGVDCIERK